MAIQNWPKTAVSADWASVDGIGWAEGQAPSTVNDSARAMGRDLAKWRDDTNASLTTTGSANAYVLSSNASYGSLTNGFCLAFKANFANTGAATLNVDGLGAKALRKWTTAGEAALSANDIVNGGHYIVQYNTAVNSAAGGWVVVNPSSLDGGSIAAATVTSTQLASNAVTTAKITDSNVTTAKIADGNVTAVKAAAGFVVDRAFASYTTNGTLAATWGADDTIPQNTEGTQILSASITPKSTTNRLRARVSVPVSHGSAGGFVGAAVFSDASANALAARAVTVDTLGGQYEITFEHEWVPGSTSARTITVRAGTNAGTAYINGNASRFFGGVLSATLVVEEIVAS